LASTSLGLGGLQRPKEWGTSYRPLEQVDGRPPVARPGKGAYGCGPSSQPDCESGWAWQGFPAGFLLAPAHKGATTVDQDQAVGMRLAAAMAGVMDRMQAQFGISDEAIGGALLQAAVQHALKAMAPMACVELLRDLADAIEHRTGEPGDDVKKGRQ
jgi:hypothetical protein